MHDNILVRIAAADFSAAPKETVEETKRLNSHHKYIVSKYKSKPELTFGQSIDYGDSRCQLSAFARKVGNLAMEAMGEAEDLHTFDSFVVGGPYVNLFLVKDTVRNYVLGNSMPESLNLAHEAPEGYRWVVGARKKDIAWDVMRDFFTKLYGKEYEIIVKLYQENKGKNGQSKITVEDKETHGYYHIRGNCLYNGYNDQLLYTEGDSKGIYIRRKMEICHFGAVMAYPGEWTETADYLHGNHTRQVKIVREVIDDADDNDILVSLNYDI